MRYQFWMGFLSLFASVWMNKNENLLLTWVQPHALVIEVHNVAVIFPPTVERQQFQI